jgi:hypothetical protein
MGRLANLDRTSENNSIGHSHSFQLRGILWVANVKP